MTDRIVVGRDSGAHPAAFRAASAKLAGCAALSRPAAAILLAAVLLLWPAVWNGYPLLFADSGTYVAQVPTGAIGWDRPPFYSLLLLLLHWRLSLWPVVLGQAVAAALLLRLALRASGQGGELRLVAVAAGLAVASSLPWFAAQVMPDVFTGLLVVALALLAGVPEALAPRARRVLAAAATVMMTLHLSHLPLAVAGLGGAAAAGAGGRAAAGVECLRARTRDPGAVWRRFFARPADRGRAGARGAGARVRGGRGLGAV